MSRHPKAPPRFIPTLTEVVPLPPPSAIPAAAPEPAPVATASQPPPWLLDIPTLADSIDAQLNAPTEAPDTLAAPPLHRPAPTSAPALPGTLSAAQEAQLVQRLLQRLESTLEQRLQQAVDHIVQEQIALMLPRLRQEVRSLVQQSVGEAVAQEWINARTPGRQDLPPPLHSAAAFSGAFARHQD